MLGGDLAHDIVSDDQASGLPRTTWRASGDERFLVVALRKHESYLEGSPAARRERAERPATAAHRRKGDAQKKATAQQLSLYQIRKRRAPSAAMCTRVLRQRTARHRRRSTLSARSSPRWRRPSSPCGAGLRARARAPHQPRCPRLRGGRPARLSRGSRRATRRCGSRRTRCRSKRGPLADDVEPPRRAGAASFGCAPPPPWAAALRCQRDADGRPLGEAFSANVMKPDEVPGAYGAWLKDQ